MKAISPKVTIKDKINNTRAQITVLETMWVSIIPETMQGLSQLTLLLGRFRKTLSYPNSGLESTRLNMAEEVEITEVRTVLEKGESHWSTH